MAGLNLDAFSASDGDMRKAIFARMLAENEEELLSIRAGSANSTRGSSAVATEDQGNTILHFESSKIDTDQSDTTEMCSQVPNEVQQLRAEHHKMSINVDQLAKELKMRDSAHNEALKQAGAQQEKLDVLQLRVNILQNENQQRKVSTATATGLMDCIYQLHVDKDGLRDKIDLLSEERHRLAENLRQKDAQLNSAKTLESRLTEKTAEVETLNAKLTTMSEKAAAQSQKLSNTLAELRKAHDTHRCQSKEITSLKAKVPNSERDGKEMWELKRDMASYVLQLDLAHHGYRVFSCSHNHLADIPDRSKATRVYDAGSTAGEMFNEWCNDETFMKQYWEGRQYLIDHHRVHEQRDPGRACWTDKLKDIRKYLFFYFAALHLLIRTVVELDMRRGMATRYT